MSKGRKRYDIYCITKAGGNVYLHRLQVRAQSVAYAKQSASIAVLQETRRHAFKVGTDMPAGYDWEAIAKARGVSVDFIRLAAQAPGGWPIYLP